MSARGKVPGQIFRFLKPMPEDSREVHPNLLKRKVMEINQQENLFQTRMKAGKINQQEPLFQTRMK